MHIDQIPLDHLSVSKANMRSGKKPPDISDILPSIIKRGGIVARLHDRARDRLGNAVLVRHKLRCEEAASSRYDLECRVAAIRAHQQRHDNAPRAD